MADVLLPIEYLDSGRIARDKINNSFNKLVQDVAGYRPHIEAGYWWIGETSTGIKAEGEKVYFRATDEYIQYSKDNENWENLVPLSELKGDKGDPGEPGEDGTDAWEYMTQSQYDALTPEQKMDGTSRAIYSDQEFYFKTLLRAASNLLHYNQQDELYADLQLENGLTPTSAFPIGINVGNVESTDGWQESGILVNALSSSGDYMRWLYGEDGKLYFDGGLGVFKEVLTSDDITDILQQLRSELSTVAFTGKSSDLDNDAEFTADKVMTMEEYEDIPGTAGDDKNYRIFEEVN